MLIFIFFFFNRKKFPFLKLMMTTAIATIQPMNLERQHVQIQSIHF